MRYVYEPSEDSRLLRSVATEYATPETTAADVGTGEGVVAAALRNAGSTVVGIDINRAACKQAASDVPTVQGHVTTGLQSSSMDLVTFNPPYLPADHRETRAERQAHGDDGEAIQAFLDDIGRVLRPDGVALLLISTRTPLNLDEESSRRGLSVTQEAEASLSFETLRVLSLRSIDQNT